MSGSNLSLNIDDETKLGQPMVNFALTRSWGTVDVFALISHELRLWVMSCGSGRLSCCSSS